MGRLRFLSPPNYEDPTDTDSDNRYEVTIHASDGTDSGKVHVIVLVANAWLDDDEVPVIVGTAQVGETLTVDEHLLSYPGLYWYKWLRNDGNTDTIIEGAYDSNYTLTEADEGKTIRVRLSLGHGSSERVLTSESTGIVAPKIPVPGNSPATGVPVIRGTAQVDETLTADTSGITDADGLTHASFIYRWIRKDGATESNIYGATGATYTLTAADEGMTIRVRVSFADDAGNTETLSSEATGAVSFNPNSPEPGLTSMSVNSGALSPTFHTRTMDYTVPEVPNAVGRITITTTTKPYYTVAVVRDAYSIIGTCNVNGGSCTWSYSDDSGNPIDPLGDAEANTPGFQVDLEEGENVFSIHVYPRGNPRGMGDVYKLTVNRAVSTPATGAPTISGAAKVGETLTVDTSAISDADGLTNASYSYQWVADGTDIAGATAMTYTLTDADEGAIVTVRVSFTDDAGNDESLTSAATGTVEARPNNPATGHPTIAGTAQVGETLTADTSGIADGDGLTNVSYSYQWVSNDGAADTDIGGATDSTYSLADADEGRTIKVRVSFTDDAGNEEELTSQATDVVAVAEPAEPPAMPTSLTAAASYDHVVLSWDDPQDDSITGYVILRRDPAIHQIGTFVTIEADTGSADTGYTDDTVETEKTYVYRIKAINGHGVSELSHWFRADTPAPPVPAPPTGLTATASHDQVVLSWDDPQDDSITGYVILRRDPAIHQIGTFVTIEADTGSADTGYTDDTVETEKTYVYRIKAINGHGVSELSHWFRADTPAPSQTNSPATGAPTISGAAQVGETLTADTSGIADADGLTSVSYQYQWLADDADIAGATDSSYTPTDGDEGAIITLRVSFTDDAGNEETMTSAATDAVTARPNSPAIGRPTILGTAQVGETLTAGTSGIADADGLTKVSYSYQWVANDGTADSGITGATASTYALVADDEGKTIKVRVSFTDDDGHEETLTSAATEEVTFAVQQQVANTPATGTPTISGTAQVGETLTADTSGIADDDGLTSVSYSYQWVANDGTADTDISGATDSTYTVAATDEGKTIKVRVSFTDDPGNAEELTSAATDTVTFAVQQQVTNTPATGAPTISGTVQVAETMAADTSGIADEDGLTGATFSLPVGCQ